jgi:orotate phosphoribosyltransferase
LDDVISTGGSIEELMVLVDQTGAQVVDCLTVVDRFDTATIR